MKKIILLCFFFQALLVFGQTNTDIPANVQLWLNREIAKTNKPIKENISKHLRKGDNVKISQMSKLTSNSYVDEFFNEKPAYLVGYIKNYSTASKSFFIRIITEDVVSGTEGFPLSVNIMADGRFTVKIPNPHPQYSYLWLGEEDGIPFFIKPDQTLGVVIDLKSIENKVEFRGELAQINKNLTEINSQTPQLNPYFVYGKGSEMSPQEFTEEYTRQYKNTQNKINEYVAKNPIASKTVEIEKFNNMIMYSSKMLEYAINKSKTERIPPEFYSFLNELPIDNPQLLAGSQSSSMINRLYHLLQNKLGQQNGLPPNFSRVIVTTPSDSNTLAYKQILKSFAQEEKLLKDSFQLKNSFLVDVLKLHSFSSDFSGLPSEEKAPFSEAIKAQIKHPFLKRQIEKLIMLDSITSGSKSFELPNGKTRDFFNEIIAKHKGKYVLVDFWGTDCGACVEDMRNTFRVREKYKNSQEIDFIFITCDSRSPSDKSYEKFILDHHLQNSYRLPTQMFDAICTAFVFNGIPHYALVDKAGKIISADFSIYQIIPELAIERLLKK